MREPLRSRSGLQAGLVAISLGLLSACGPPRDEVPSRRLEARLPAPEGFAPCRGIAVPRGPLRSVDCGGPPPPGKAAGLLRAEETGRFDALEAASLRIAASTEPGSLARALSRLDSALPRSASLDVAQGAVEHGLALRTGDPPLLVAALEHAEAGWEAVPDSAPARFDRALISADVGLCRRAANLWRSYLALDADSPWAKEARTRLVALPCLTDLPPASPDLLIDRVLDTLLPAWSETRQADGAAPGTGEIHAIGEQLRGGGEPFADRLAAELDQLGGDPAYASAVAEYVRGRAAFRDERYEAAGEPLRRALPLLDHRRSVLAPWCRIWLAGLDLYAGRFAASRQRLEGLADSELVRASPVLDGRVLWTLALAALRAGELGPSFDLYTRAASAFERGGYGRSHAAMQVSRAEILGDLGLDRESWRQRILALRDLQERRPSKFLHNALVDAAREAGLQGLHRAAEAFVEEAVLRAQALKAPLFLTEARLAQGDVAARRGDRPAARERFDRALEASSRLSHGVVRERYEANARLGLLAQTDAAARKPDELERVAAFYAAKGPRWRQLLALRLAAEERQAVGDARGGAGVLGRALEVVRFQRESLGGGAAELAFLDTTRSLFDERIAAAVAAGEVRQALLYLEESHQLAGAAAHGSEALPALLARPAKPVVVVFAFVGDDLLWWRLLDGFLDFGRVPTSAVNSAIELLIAGGRQRVTAADLERAYEVLLADPLRGVAPGRRLALVLDGPLHRLPFAALRNPKTGVRLVEERAITMHPTLSEALRSGAQPAEPNRRSWRVVVVGDPAFDQEALPSLPRLAGAEQEAREVAADYGSDTVLLTGAQATPRAVRESLAGVQVLHLAAHAIPGGARSDGALVLAAERPSGASGLVATDDLLPKALELQVVVLSACSSLGRESTRAAGVLGPARPFLRKGVPAVLATLWPIEDRSLTDLMGDFHRGLIAGLAASEALRQAQLRAAERGGEDVYSDWAGLQLVGELPAAAAGQGD
jgi:CHAT domain